MPAALPRVLLLGAALGLVACGSESGGAATSYSAPATASPASSSGPAAPISPCPTRGANVPNKDDFCTEVALTPQAGGLESGEITPGSGPGAQPGQKLSVQYTGWLTNGTMFDSSRGRGQAFAFTLGNHEVIQGWDQGLLGAKAGSKRRLVIPPSLGYGAQGAGGVIPPNATLIFDIEVVSIA